MYDFNCSGNFSNTASGTFLHGAKITFNSGSTQTLDSGGDDFWHIDVANGSTVQLSNHLSQGVGGILRSASRSRGARSIRPNAMARR